VPFGVYVHVPFCARRCDYCAFATWTDRHHLMAGYAGACRREVLEAELPPASSVYFGGGTPSLLPAELLCSILAAVPRLPHAEVTVECNPDSLSAGACAAYRDAGVTRLSFGAQSTVPHVLAALGRTHAPGDLAAAVAQARAAGFGTFNVDLIFGAVGESIADWAASLDTVLALDPPHVSAYALTVEPGTPLAADPGRRPDDDDQAAKYEMADEALRAAGLGWYEISNWARPGHECTHNLLYWAQGEYLGVGCAAHGHTIRPDGTSRRWWNVRTPERYIAAVAGGQSPEAGSETLDAVTRWEEAVTLALRTCTGAGVGHDAGLVADGLAAWRDGRLVLTRRGRLLANDATARFLGAAHPADGPPLSRIKG
jgi:putative oxygen-independent coproporphyrinogen III oxidase